jgi:hypothetical protein
MPEVVDRQVDAYNRHDVDAFVACYAPGIVVEDASGQRLMVGHDAMRDAYAPFFDENPDLRAKVEHRVQLGAYVVDHEHLHGLVDPAAPDEAVVVYHLADGLIDHVRIIG